MARRRQFLMMRTRGISGPTFRKKAGWHNHLIKSVGNFIGLNSVPVGAITDPLNGSPITDPLNGDFITDPNP